MRLTLYDGRTGALRRRVDAGRWERVQCIGFLEDSAVILGVDTGGATAIRSVTPDLEVWSDVPLDHADDSSAAAVLTPRGLILTGRSTRTIRLLQPPRMALPHGDLGAEVGAAQVAVSGDGARIATLVRPRFPLRYGKATAEELSKFFQSRLQVWDSRTLRPLSRIAELPKGYVTAAIAYGPTAETLAVGCHVSEDQAPLLLATVTPQGEITFDRLGTHTSDVRALAFTPDGRRLVTGSSTIPGGIPAELICWAVDVRSSLLWKRTYPASVTAIAVSPDGKRLVIGGTDKVLRLLPLDRPFDVLATVDVGAKIAAVAFAQNSPLVAVTHFTGQVHVFEVSDRSLVLRSSFDQPGAAFSAVAFGPEGQTLYVNGASGVQRWDVQAMKPLDPVLPRVDHLETFALNSRPEAVIAVTSQGKLILRTVPNP
jgi:hypothetical protein